MIVRVDLGLYINLENIIAIELQEPTTDMYGDIYKWAFYTTSPTHSVFFSKVFDSKEEALSWFEETFGEIVERGV